MKIPPVAMNDRFTPPDRLKMVGWYDPGQLLQTAIEVAISTIFGRHSDHRLIEALEPKGGATDDYYDYSDADDLWVDYVADVGDGWNSTYAVAHALAQPTLTLQGPGGGGGGGGHDTRRGRILVLGGDEVYPVASRSEYGRRLVQPYKTALPWTDPPHPQMFAVAGNHDWYDSLVSFTRQFCSRAWLGGWQAPQSRSYFALKLPHGWWLLGTDIQLSSDIDAPQVAYFEKAAARMKDGDRVILCNAEPHWIYANNYGKNDTDYNENNLAFLELKVLKKRVAVFLAGDLHHYRRHEALDGSQKITAGGGGAFLHPTHGPDVSKLADGYVLAKGGCFPPIATSKRLCLRNLLFLFLNPWFGVVTGILYLLTAWSAMVNVGEYGLSKFLPALSAAFNGAIRSPVAAFWAVALFGGFVLFTDTHSRPYRIIAGTLHGLLHVAASFFIGWGATYLGVTTLGLRFGSTPQLLLAGGLIFLGGWVAGSFILGFYLWISLNVFRRHSNEAFSSLGSPDWKNFLRLRIDRQGELTIFPVGIRRVPRRWKESPEGSPSRLVPDDKRATRPELIEPPITVKVRGRRTDAG